MEYTGATLASSPLPMDDLKRLSMAWSPYIEPRRLVLPPSSAIVEEEEKAEDEDGESGETCKAIDENGRRKGNMDQNWNQPSQKKPLHKRGPNYRYHAMCQYWIHGLQRNALTTI